VVLPVDEARLADLAAVYAATPAEEV
jgi:hypothetical protein